MIPLFKQGAIYQGINRGVSVIWTSFGGDISLIAYQKKSTKPVPISIHLVPIYHLYLPIFSFGLNVL